MNNDGGDVYAAMAIGAMFRAARAEASVPRLGKCLSSCVFVLAGSVKRYYGGGPVGIHRPYSTDTESVSYEVMQTRATRLGSDVSAYLSMMNIPPLLYQNMRLVPPDKINILNPDEMKSYGLYEDDPVFAELKDNFDANKAGVSKSEYLGKKDAISKCQLQAYNRMVQESNDSGYVKDALNKFKKAWADCYKTAN